MKTYLILIITCLSTLNAWSQSKSLRIQSITLEGIKKNDEAYLRRFIKSTPDSLFDQTLAQEDIEQLRRRTGIANAELLLDTLDQETLAVRFKIREQITLLPQLGIGGIRNNFWWRAGIEEYNLFGRESVLLVNYLHNDGRPNFKIFFANPRIQGSDWGYGLDLNHAGSIEPLYFPESTVDFKYDNTGIGVLGFKNFGFNKRLSVGTNFFQEAYVKNNPNDFGTTEGPDQLQLNKLLFKVNYEINQVNYYYFYREGFQSQLFAQSVATFGERALFWSLTYEGKKFWRPYETGNIALRLRAAIATNTPSPFAPFVLDSNVNIRGVGNRVDRGTAQLVLNLEFRQTVFHLEGWAAQVITFSDWGTWRNPGGKLEEIFDSDQFRHFIGGGVRLINKKVFRSTLRLDYGFDLWNPEEQRGFVLGVGQYF
jgi:outer membrane protein assembly factor BamA